MNRKTLFTIWAGLFILYAALGFIPERSEPVQVFLMIFSLIFFLPPALLVKYGDTDTVKLVRNLAALSLTLTAAVLILNFVLARGPAFLGNVLHFILAVVSAPMLACGNWALSMFLWACVLMGSIRKLR